MEPEHTELTVCHPHPGITNGFDFEHIVLVRQLVKCQVESIKHVGHLPSLHCRGHVGKANDITEEAVEGGKE